MLNVTSFHFKVTMDLLLLVLENEKIYPVEHSSTGNQTHFA